MAEELSYDQLSSMKLADYKKAFKKKILWKKAKGVLLLADYKLDGKKQQVAIPYKKITDLKEVFKAVKLPLKKVAICTCIHGKDDEGNDTLTFEIQKGGMKAEIVNSKLAPMFAQLINHNVVVAGSSETGVVGTIEEESNQEEEVTVSNEENSNEEEVTQEKGSNVLSDAKRQKYATMRVKMKENMQKILKYLEKLNNQAQS